MRNNFNILIIILLFIYCSSDLETQNIVLIDNILTHELTFGSQNIDDRFIIADPLSMCMNDKDEIILADEGIIKVYDSSGRPKEILGKKGQGPGEFEYASAPRWSPAKFLTVIDNRWSYHVYDSDNNLKYEKRYLNDKRYQDYFDERNYRTRWLYKIYDLDNEHRVSFTISINSNISVKEWFPQYKTIFYETPDSLHEIVDSRSKMVLVFRSSFMGICYIGELTGEMLSENVLVYSNPAYDKKEENSQNYYVLHVVNLPEKEKKEISRVYTPFTIPESMKEAWGVSERFSDNERIKKVVEDIEKEHVYFPPFHKIAVDNGRLFVFTFT